MLFEVNNPIILMAKTQITLLAILAVAAITLYSFHTNQTTHNNVFELWKNKYGKSYSSQDEAYRISVWIKNLAFVETHNKRYEAGLESYNLEMNEFADLPSEELRKI